MILNFFFNAGNTPILEGMNLNIVEEKKPNGKFNDGKSFITIDGIRQRIRLHDKIKNLISQRLLRLIMIEVVFVRSIHSIRT